MFLAGFTSRCKSVGCIKSQCNSDAKWEPLRSPGGDSLGWRRAWLLLIKIAVPGACWLCGRTGSASCREKWAPPSEGRCKAQSTPQTWAWRPGRWQKSASWSERTLRKSWNRGDEKLGQLTVVKMPFTGCVLRNNSLWCWAGRPHPFPQPPLQFLRTSHLGKQSPRILSWLQMMWEHYQSLIILVRLPICFHCPPAWLGGAQVRGSRSQRTLSKSCGFWWNLVFFTYFLNRKDSHCIQSCNYTN